MSKALEAQDGSLNSLYMYAFAIIQIQNYLIYWMDETSER